MKRIAFMISGLIDAAIGGVLLMIGLGFLPLQAANYGIPNWLVNALGGIMFLLGVATFAYNLSRMAEE